MLETQSHVVPLKKSRSSWIYAALAAFAMLLVSLVPQVYFHLTREPEWRAPYVSTKGDEAFYAAYVNALADGRPRKNDPFRGQDKRQNAALPESYLSIQFLPAYTLAYAARTLGISVPDLFAVLPCVFAFIGALAMFWLIKSLTGDSLWAASGTIFVLCLGTLVTLFGPWLYVGDPNAPLVALPFLRRYQPAFAFPFLITFFTVVWHMLTTESKTRRRVLSCIAALIFTVLVFSYFYLWTAAAAWLFLLTLLVLVLRPAGWLERFKLLCVTGVLSMIPLAPYLLLLTGRDTSKDGALDIVYRHKPHVFVISQSLGLLLATCLVFAYRRGWLNLRSWKMLFIGSFALLPVVVFNQQVFTGRSLQPYHYELFVTNYGVLFAFVVLVQQLSGAVAAMRNRAVVMRRLLVCAATVALGWGVAESVFRMRRTDPDYRYINDAQAVSRRLAQLGRDRTNGTVDTNSLVLATDGRIADHLPTVSPQAMLWNFNMIFIPTGTLAEERERLLHFLYYTNADPLNVYRRVQGAGNERTSTHAYLLRLFRREMSQRDSEATQNPEAEQALALDYARQVRTFDRERAARLPLSYLVIAEDEANAALTNIDRWYERDAGERYGRFTLYRLKLRP